MVTKLIFSIFKFQFFTDELDQQVFSVNVTCEGLVYLSVGEFGGCPSSSLSCLEFAFFTCLVIFPVNLLAMQQQQKAMLTFFVSLLKRLGISLV